MQASTISGCPEATKEVSGAREHDDAYERVLASLTFDTCPLTVLLGIVIRKNCAGCGGCIMSGVYDVLASLREGKEARP